MATNNKPVVIVGAGLSGLFAAKVLHESDIPVVVVEAQDRVGGRTFTQKGVDQGAGYVGSTQTAILDLLEKFGMQTSQVPGDGLKYTFSLNGVVKHNECVLADLYEYLTPMELFLVIVAIIELYWKGWSMPQDMGPALIASPDNHDEEWDSMSVQNWINIRFPRFGNKFEDARKIFQFICRIPLGVEASEVSFLYFIRYLKNAGGFFRLLFPAQDKIVVGGTQQIGMKLNEDLPEVSRARLSKPVTSIQQTGDDERPVVVTAGGEEIEGDRCVLAVTPHTRSFISYEPLMGPIYHQLPQRVPMGTTIKVHLFYERKFWLTKGYNGNVTIFDGNSVGQVYDVTEPDGTPCLQGFYVGNVGRFAAMQTEDWRKDNVTKELHRVFDEEFPEALNPKSYVEYIWDNHPYIGGAPVGTFAPGTLTSFAEALSTPTRRIHFAGTETSTEWTGYMEGAIRAGQRVAEELCQVYNKPPPLPLPHIPSVMEEILDMLNKMLDWAGKSAKKWYVCKYVSSV